MPEMKDDQDIATIALLKDINIYRHISTNLQQDKSFLIGIVKRKPKLTNLLDDTLQNDKVFLQKSQLYMEVRIKRIPVDVLFSFSPEK